MKPNDSPDAADYIKPSQLCIGLHVHLDLSWTEHPFAFSNFKIKSLDQVAAIQGLGLERVRYSPGKSDCAPLAATTEAPVPRTQAGACAHPALVEKRSQRDRLQAHRERVAACERELAAHVRIAQAMERNLLSKPEAVRQNAANLVDSMAGSLLMDADVTVHLMSDTVGGERLHMHNLNVAVLALILGRELKLSAGMLNTVGMGAMFHDIGLAELPARLRTPGKHRTPQELQAYQQHCDSGTAMAARMNLAPEIVQVITQHHEHTDGSGYPRRLKSQMISRAAQLVAIADQFDELCNPHAPAEALTPHEALSMMYGQQRNRYDLTALMTFVRCVGIYPPGTLVALSNGALGMVLSVNSSRPLKPTVVIHDPAVQKAEAIVVELEREPDVSIARALRPQQLTREQSDYLSPRKRMAYYFSSDSKDA